MTEIEVETRYQYDHPDFWSDMKVFNYTEPEDIAIMKKVILKCKETGKLFYACINRDEHRTIEVDINGSRTCDVLVDPQHFIIGIDATTIQTRSPESVGELYQIVACDHKMDVRKENERAKEN